MEKIRRKGKIGAFREPKRKRQINSDTIEDPYRREKNISLFESEFLCLKELVVIKMNNACPIYQEMFEKGFISADSLLINWLKDIIEV